jgi:quercetin dioxygenase-like cupin family protein
MQIYCFDPKTAASIQQHDSRKAAICHVANTAANARIAFIYLEAGGLVGYHQAAIDQLFLIVEGSGWVTGADRRKETITSGRAAFWKRGEWHESGSDTGMMVVVVEAEAIDLTMWD